MALFPRQENSNSNSKSKFLLLPKLIREACAQCSHGSCLRSGTASTLSSLGSSSSSTTLGEADLDHKQSIMLEIQSRIMKAKSSKPKELLPFSDGMLTWAVSPTTGRVHITPLRKTATAHGEEECEGDGYGGGGGGDETEEFFSVKSYFSCCSIDSSSSSVEFKDTGGGGGGGRSILEEFRHCEGWPFGLCRRAVVLPPLPSSPSDSWMWRKRNLVSKTSLPKFRINLDH